MINRITAWLEEVKKCWLCDGYGYFYCVTYSWKWRKGKRRFSKHDKRYDCDHCDGTGLRKPWRWKRQEIKETIFAYVILYFAFAGFIVHLADVVDRIWRWWK